MRGLLTGFGAFGADTTNPTAVAVATGMAGGRASTPGVDALVDALRAAGIPAAASSSAGHDVCHVSCALLGHPAEHHPGVIGGFVHVPCSHEQVLTEASPRPSLSSETITAALRVVVIDCAGRAPRRDDVRRDASSSPPSLGEPRLA